MGRPKEFDAETVLAAATDCFWADGIARTSISSLVAAMNIQRSSFYNSYTSRETILAMVLERYFAESPLYSLINTEAEDSGSPADLMLIDLVLEFSNFLAERGQGRGCLFFNGLSELGTQEPQLKEIFQDYHVRLTNGLSTLLDRIERERNPAVEAGNLSLQHLLCLFIGLAHYSKLDPNEQHLSKIGLDQLAGLSPHFDRLIKSEPQSIDRMRLMA